MVDQVAECKHRRMHWEGVWILVDGDTGRASMGVLVARQGQLPKTCAQKTGSGGYHFYFAANGQEVRNSASQLEPGLDIRGDGGYVIFPTSIHPDTGLPYMWVRGLSILEIEPVTAPDWLARSVSKTKSERRAQEQPPRTNGADPTSNDAYVRAALEGAAGQIVAAPNGQQETILNSEAFGIGRLVGGSALPFDEAFAALVNAGMKMTNFDTRRPWHARTLRKRCGARWTKARWRPALCRIRAIHGRRAAPKALQQKTRRNGPSRICRC